MKLIGNLKKQVENESTKEGRKKLIEKAGMKLTDDELDKVAGGSQINATSGTHSVFGSFSASGSPQLALGLIELERANGELTEEELREYWESRQGN